MKYEPIDWKGIKDLGKVPDRVIADRLGVSHTTVGYHRRKLGAGAYRGRAIDRYAAVSHLFGVLPDAQLARDLGVSKQAVMRERRVRGIPKPPKPVGSWLCGLVAEICEFAIDDYRTETGGDAYWMTTCRGLEDQKREAWRALAPVAYVIACYYAQYCPGGANGVDAELPFEALRMWENMSMQDRAVLAQAFYDTLVQEG